MIDSRMFEPDDFSHVTGKANGDIGLTDAQLRKQAEGGDTFTITMEGFPVAIVGASYLWPGVGQVWTIVSEDVRGHGIYLTKFCKSILEGMAEPRGTWRYNAIVLESAEENQRWIKLLGFEKEAVMIGAAPDRGNLIAYRLFTKLWGVQNE